MTVGRIQRVLALALVAFVAAVHATAVVQETETSTRHLQIVNFREELVDAVNAKRAERGLTAFCINRKLMTAAQVQSNDMATNSFVKTTGSDASTPKTRAIAQGMNTTSVTEIVGAGYKTVDTILAAWLKSSHSNSTIYSSRAFIGPGYTYDASKKYVHYWTLDFSNGQGEVCENATTTS
ncbi:hypothetical protein BBJ28_00021580 [Nothophytophthora sp. Chile5]|nr:hypothetical protein BBJ28_00021580 [Nothophytophthora sp. Chile5]